MKNQETHEQARKRVKAKVEFRIHLIIYMAVITLLIVINLITSADYLWFKWPLMGWGVAVIIHALKAFSSSPKSTIKDQMIEK